MKHKDLKKNNSYLLLQSLYQKQSATMLDLVNDTHLSQSTVRNMLRAFEREGIVKSIGVNDSTGGRCPNQFSLVDNKFTILCVYVHRAYVDLRIVQLYTSLETSRVTYHNYEELYQTINHYCRQYNVCYIVIAVEGIVEGLCYYTDHNNEYIFNDWIAKMQQQMQVPIHVENDVKTMHQGMRVGHTSKKDVVFLYINTLGMSCSFMYENKIVKGHKGILGELGLLPYQGTTINQALRICENQKDFLSIVMYLLQVICVAMDPQEIIVSSLLPFDVDVVHLTKAIKKTIYQEYPIVVEASPMEYLDIGQAYIGMMKVLQSNTKNK